jgi:NADH-quinone oxidoreductase subunit D
LGVDTGAFSGFLHMFEMREKIYEIYEEVCGSRLTTNIGRVGGFERDFSPKAIQLLKIFLDEFPLTLKDFEKMFNRNRIFMDRTIGVGPISAERAMNYGFTGPNLRAAGVDYDVRVMSPYSSYDDFEFDIPVGTQGDTYDRFMVRNEEMWQSLRLIRAALDRLGEGPYHADVPEYYLPPKDDVYNSMEGLIYHFKVVMGEWPAPVGDVYHSVEGGNGELGYSIVSDGGRQPYRWHIRRPCFIFYQAFGEMVKGQMISDAILVLSSLNVIAGELDA